MAAPISTTTPVQQPQPIQQQACAPSYNAVQLNIHQPGVNVAAPAQQPLPSTATQQWQA